MNPKKTETMLDKLLMQWAQIGSKVRLAADNCSLTQLVLAEQSIGLS